jgi:choline monooxygenase
MSKLRLDVHPDLAQASTLPSRFYTDPAVHSEVVERIFARSWQFVGDTDPLRAPGSVVPKMLLEGSLNEPIVATRDMQDRLHVLSNVCTHRGYLVAEAPGNERFLRCRYHGRRFGLDGGFQSMPEFEGVCGFPSSADDLPKVPHGFWDKLLFAGVQPACSFDDWIGPVRERLGWLPVHEFTHRPERSREYLVQANWALYVDNYLEGFHIPFIHAGLNEVLDYENYRTETFAWGNLQLAEAKGAEDVFDLPVSSPDYGKRISAYYYWLFPNTMLNFYPWGLSVNVIAPLGPNRTRVSFVNYGWDDRKYGRGAGAALDRVEREDEVVVEGVQLGMRSRFYDRGRYSVKREGNVHHFHRLIAAALQPQGA